MGEKSVIQPNSGRIWRNHMIVQREDKLASGYVVTKEVDHLKFATRKQSHWSQALYFGVFTTIFLIFVLNLNFPSSAWPAKLFFWAVTLLMFTFTLTQLRLLIIGETYIFRRDKGILTRADKQLCLLTEIKAIGVRELSGRSQSLYLQVLLENKKAITLDYVAGYFGLALDQVNRDEVSQVAAVIADYIGVGCERFPHKNEVF